jgi:hypothetical protein
MDQSRSRAAARAAKLLALASSPNPHEAAAAREAARRIMLEHGLSEAEVLAGCDDDLGEVSLGGSERGSTWRFVLATAAARYCGCEAVALLVRGRRKVRVVGRRGDARHASEIFRSVISLVSQLEREVARAVEAGEVSLDPGDAALAAESFRLGAASALAALLGAAARARGPGEAAPRVADPSPEAGVLARVASRPESGGPSVGRYEPETVSPDLEEDADWDFYELGFTMVRGAEVLEDGTVRIRDHRQRSGT